jgi:hypothetical protein
VGPRAPMDEIRYPNVFMSKYVCVYIFLYLFLLLMYSYC